MRGVDCVENAASGSEDTGTAATTTDGQEHGAVDEANAETHGVAAAAVVAVVSQSESKETPGKDITSSSDSDD